MPSTELLEAAGRRAALGPVPPAPSIDALNAEVDRRRTKKRRAIGGGVAALAALVALPIGVMLLDGGEPDVVTLATDDGLGETVSDAPTQRADEPATTTPPASIDASSSTVESLPDVLPEPPSARGPFAGLSDENFDLQLTLGDESFSIAVVSGEDAAARAAEAEAAADETREIDDQTVWIDNGDDVVTASALFDDETFVEVRGPKEQIEQVLDLVAEHGDGPVMFFDPGEFAERFDLPEGFLDDDGLFGEGFSFEDGEFPMAPFFDDDAMEKFRTEMDEFADCMEVTVDRSGSTTKIEIPDCELPEFDTLFEGGVFEGGAFNGEVFEDFAFDLEGLLDGFVRDFEGSAAD